MCVQKCVSAHDTVKLDGKILYELYIFVKVNQIYLSTCIIYFLVITALIPFAYVNGLVLYWLTTVKQLHRKVLNCLTSHTGT